MRLRRRNKNVVLIIDEITRGKHHQFNHVEYFWDNTLNDNPGPAIEILSSFKYDTVFLATREPLCDSEDDMAPSRTGKRARKRPKRFIDEDDDMLDENETDRAAGNIEQEEIHGEDMENMVVENEATATETVMLSSEPEQDQSRPQKKKKEVRFTKATSFRSSVSFDSSSARDHTVSSSEAETAEPECSSQRVVTRNAVSSSESEFVLTPVPKRNTGKHRRSKTGCLGETSSEQPSPKLRTKAAPTFEMALHKARSTIQLQELQIKHLKTTVTSLSEDKVFLQDQLQSALKGRPLGEPSFEAQVKTEKRPSATYSLSSSVSSTSDSSSSEEKKKKKTKKKHKASKKVFCRVRTPEASIQRYRKVLKLVQKGSSKNQAYEKANVDRNTIVNQAPIAELNSVNPGKYEELRRTFPNNGNLVIFAKLCSAVCAVEPEVSKIAKLKRQIMLLDIGHKK